MFFVEGFLNYLNLYVYEYSHILSKFVLQLTKNGKFFYSI